jgi:hypothetical protein
MITFKKKLDNVYEQVKQLSNDSFEKELHPSVSNGLTTIESKLKEIKGCRPSSALDTFEKLLNELSIWKKISDKDYKTIEKIYFKLGGK